MNFARKMPGCGKVTYENETQLVVVGGEDMNGNKLKSVETELKKNNEKVAKLEAEVQDIHQKISEKDQTVSKINKKFNFLKEKVTLLFDLETKLDTIEKRIESISKISVNTIENVADSKTLQKAGSKSADP